ncbi:MAG: hypothetical protein M1819_005036 [Sarea resinae]|nr:MAG: hypothetical protein M1819_005036 [Sarea resinae]
MGSIAIWSMHFIGNRAIVLGNGESELQIAYSSGYTAASFFLPIVVLPVAFWLVGVNEKVVKLRLICCGFVTGAAICGMHYTGQQGIANYHCEYQWPFVMGAAIIAVLASSAALSIFFVLRAAWTNVWWKRVVCASILATAVSGMHWVASVGTQYRLKRTGHIQDRISSSQTVIVVVVLALASSVILLGSAGLAQRRRTKSAHRAQQMVLACATFDPEGRLMVTPEGLLPSHKITNTFLERSLDDVFSVAHPVFLWIFRVTRNWSGVAELIPGMRAHLQASSALKSSRPGTSDHSPDAEAMEGIEDYSIIIRELFCVAASELAETIKEPLENIGVLYDEIMVTGTTTHGRYINKGRLRSGSSTPSLDLERGPPILFGRGQLLFVVRRASRTETARLQASGFRFAAVHNVVDILARSMQVTREDLLKRIDGMREYSEAPRILEQGVHLACFALRPLRTKTFEILVRKDATNLIPTTTLPLASLDLWHMEFLAQMNGFSVHLCLDFLRNRSITKYHKYPTFARQLYDHIAALAREINDPLFMNATLLSRPIQAPCRNFREDMMPDQATLIVFYIAEAHLSAKSAPLGRMAYTPLTLFQCQQHCYAHSIDHEIFSRQIHREFAPVVDHKKSGSERSSLQTTSYPSPTRGVSFWPFSNPGSRTSSVRVKPESSSEKGLVTSSVSRPFGGIMVSQEVTVDVSSRGSRGDLDVEMTTMGTQGEAGVEPEEIPTFVDDLWSVTLAKWGGRRR